MLNGFFGWALFNYVVSSTLFVDGVYCYLSSILLRRGTAVCSRCSSASVIMVSYLSFDADDLREDSMLYSLTVWMPVCFISFFFGFS